jgi:hypothetical protein
VIVLLCCGGIFWFFNSPSKTKMESDQTLASTPTPTLTPTAKASSAPLKKISLSTPDKLGNRNRITDPTHTKLASQAVAELKKDAKVLAAIAGFYGTTDPKKNKVRLAGATTSVILTRPVFEASFASIATEAGAAPMTGVTEVNPGPLGGWAKCGLLKVESLPAATCAWGDEGSYVTVIWYNRQVTSQIKAELITIRAAVETKF